MLELARIRAKFDLASSKKDLVRDELIQAFEYTNPIAAPNRANDSLPNRLICYDNTAEDAAVTLSNMLTGYLVPTDQQWARMSLSKYADPAQLPVDAINRMLETETDRFFASVNNSNFYLAASHAMGNLVRAGSGCIAIELGEDGLSYYSVPINELLYLDDGCGCPDTVFRDHLIPARSIVQWYPDAPDNIKKIADIEPDRELRMIEAMYAIEDGKSDQDKYMYEVFVGEGWDKVCSQSLAYRNFIVFRWDRTNSLTWGDSPVRRSLPSIRTINMLRKFQLATAEFASQGAWISSDESLRDQTLIPGTVLYSTNPQDLVPVPFPGKFDVSHEMFAQMQTDIRAMLFADAMPPASPSARYSAEELQQRQSMFFQKIGTVAHRLDHEFLRPIIVQTIRALQSIGKMTPLSVDGHRKIDIESNDLIQIETRSLLKRVEANRELQTIIQGVSAAVQVVGPTASALIDMNALARHLLSLSGIPASMIKSERQVQQEQTAMNAVQAIGGLQAAQGGQGGNPEMARSTGQAVAGLASAAQKNPQAAQALLSAAMPAMQAMQGGQS